MTKAEYDIALKELYEIRNDMNREAISISNDHRMPENEKISAVDLIDGQIICINSLINSLIKLQNFEFNEIPNN